MSQKNTFIDVPHDPWKGVRLPRKEAARVLNLAKWPKGKPRTLPDALETPNNDVSIYELIDTMRVIHSTRGRALTMRRREQIRSHLRRALGAPHYGNATFEDLFERLGI